MKVYYLFFLLFAACGNSNSGTPTPVTSNPGVNSPTPDNPGQSTDKNPPLTIPPAEPQPQIPTTPSDSQPIQPGVKNVDPKTKIMTARPGATNVTPSDSAEIQLREN